MIGLIDFLMESAGQKIKYRRGNRPYNPEDDVLVKNRNNRPARLKEFKDKKRINKNVEYFNKQLKPFLEKLDEFCKYVFRDTSVRSWDLPISNVSLGYYEGDLQKVYKIGRGDNSTCLASLVDGKISFEFSKIGLDESGANMIYDNQYHLDVDGTSIGPRLENFEDSFVIVISFWDSLFEKAFSKQIARNADTTRVRVPVKNLIDNPDRLLKVYKSIEKKFE